MRSIKILSAVIIAAALFEACSSDKKDQAVTPPESPAKGIQAPFRFHKAIEVKPGLTLDVLSWGRGSESAGAYLILRSDSLNMKYRSVTGELDGKIMDAWNMDMDSDGNPELYIQAKGEGEGSHLNMYVYEFSSDGSYRELRFPDLSSKSKKGYKGGDSIYIKDEKLMREFPVVDENPDSAAVKPTGKKVLVYTLRNNDFQVEEVKEENKEDKKDR